MLTGPAGSVAGGELGNVSILAAGGAIFEPYSNTLGLYPVQYILKGRYYCRLAWDAMIRRTQII